MVNFKNCLFASASGHLCSSLPLLCFLSLLPLTLQKSSYQFLEKQNRKTESTFKHMR